MTRINDSFKAKYARPTLPVSIKLPNNTITRMFTLKLVLMYPATKPAMGTEIV